MKGLGAPSGPRLLAGRRLRPSRRKLRVGGRPGAPTQGLRQQRRARHRRGARRPSRGPLGARPQQRRCLVCIWVVVRRPGEASGLTAVPCEKASSDEKDGRGQCERGQSHAGELEHADAAGGRRGCERRWGIDGPDGRSSEASVADHSRSLRWGHTGCR